MKLVRILSGLLLSGAVAGAQPRPDLLASLVRDSPFLPGTGGDRPQDNGPGRFEFRGVVAEADGYIFSVYDQSRREAGWVRLNEPDQPFVARHYDPAKDTLAIEHAGQTLTLSLKRAPVQPLAATPSAQVSPPPLPTTGKASPTAGNAPSPPHVSNAQEAQRLQNIADEIRRRRALRQTPPPEQPAAKP